MTEDRRPGRILVPRDLVRCEPHFSVTEVNETGNAKATDRCSSRIKTSAAEGVLKILEIYAKATES